MIEYIRGTVDSLTPAEAVVEANGVGYKLFITLNTYSAIQGKPSAKLLAYEVIREDAHLLFGFATRDERELFTLLVGVNSIGPQTARMILSAFTPAELVGIIQTEDVRLLKSVKGIGPKAAQRIIMDLQDKVATLQGTSLKPAATATPAETEAMKEATGALVTLGFSPAPVQKALGEILKKEPGAPAETLIKLALKML